MEGTVILFAELYLPVDSANPQPVRKMERKLFEAIKKGDVENVRNTVSSSHPKYDLNCVNHSGQTVLQVAADLEDVSVRNDMIMSLLSTGADLELALLQAVRQNNPKSIEILLKFYGIPSEKPDPISVVKPIGVKRQRDVTPLILAACLQHFKIVKLLLEHGFTIPSQTDFQQSVFSNGVVSEKLRPAVFLLNCYRALASPVYMAASFLQDPLSGPHPVYVACALDKELCNMAEQEYEFRKEYLELSDGCKEFAVALLNECRSMKEVRCVMEVQHEEKSLTNTQGAFLNTLELAIVTKNGKFVCHPYSQLVLNTIVYRCVLFLEKSSWKQFAILMASAMFPFLILLWLIFENFFPTHNIARMFRSPCMKFLIHCGSYQTFLLMFVWTTAFQHPRSIFLGYTYIDWVVLLFVFGQLVDIIKEVYQQGRVRFFSNNWNYLALTTVTSFLLHYVFWWAGRVALMGKRLDSMTWETHAKYRSYRIVLTSDCFLAVAILLAFAHNFSFIQVNSSIGPLLQAFIQMLFDVTKFFVYFIFVLLAFVVSFTKLYSQYEKARQHYLPSPKAINNTAGLLDVERFSSSIFATFWSLFGQIHRNNFKIDEKEYDAIWQTGVTLFGAFNIVAVLVGLNMLIAMLNDSYTRIMANLDTEWKLTRTRLWLSWVYKKGVLPPPLNILYLLLPLLWFIRRLDQACFSKKVSTFFSRLVKKKPKATWKVQRIDEKERREVIRHLILRNLAKKSCYVESGTESSDSDEEQNIETAVSLASNAGKCQTNRPETTKL